MRPNRSNRFTWIFVYRSGTVCVWAVADAGAVVGVRRQSSVRRTGSPSGIRRNEFPQRLVEVVRVICLLMKLSQRFGFVVDKDCASADPNRLPINGSLYGPQSSFRTGRRSINGANHLPGYPLICLEPITTHFMGGSSRRLRGRA